jgi:hypothetical protein
MPVWGLMVSDPQAIAMANWVDLDRLPPSVLQLLAAKERSARPRYDNEAMAEELAAMVLRGWRPTIGWYHRLQSIRLLSELALT